MKSVTHLAGGFKNPGGLAPYPQMVTVCGIPVSKVALRSFETSAISEVTCKRCLLIEIRRNLRGQIHEYVEESDTIPNDPFTLRAL